MYEFNEFLQDNKLKIRMRKLCNKYTNQNAEHTKHKNTNALNIYLQNLLFKNKTEQHQ